MVKNHPFQNGNKRIAITTLLVFLYLNDRWLNAGLNEFYDFSTCVAASKAENKASVVLEIRKFIKDHMIKISSGT